MNSKYNEFIKILKEEIQVAQGCTEPISGAYVGATAFSNITGTIKKIEIIASKNIVKNARGVNIPNGGKLKGIVPSVILGIVAGDASEELEVLKNVKKRDVLKTEEILNTKDMVSLEYSKSPAKLHIIVKLTNDFNETVLVEVMHSHTNIIKILKNEKIIREVDCDPNDFQKQNTDRSILDVKSILNFIDEVNVEDLTMIKKQIKLNSEIAKEGLNNDYGINVGKVTKTSTEDLNLEYDIRRIAQSLSSAGSDARMAGNTLPVAIVSGSGNQGITTSMPVYAYANHLNVNEETLIKAVALSDLIAIHIKTKVGKLSPLCGVSLAAIGSGCGIMYFFNANYEQYSNMIMNNIATNAGMICDGAKASCAMKIQSSIQTSIMAANLAMENYVVNLNEGIVGNDVEETINNLAKIATSMNPIDETIIEILEKSM